MIVFAGTTSRIAAGSGRLVRLEANVMLTKPNNKTVFLTCNNINQTHDTSKYILKVKQCCAIDVLRRCSGTSFI